LDKIYHDAAGRRRQAVVDSQCEILIVKVNTSPQAGCPKMCEVPQAVISILDRC
jgi:hypothetical protein